jgi:hypothetical protein
MVGIDPLGIAFVRAEGAVIDPKAVVEQARQSIDLDPPAFSLVRTARSPVPYRRLAVLFQNIGEAEASREMRELAKRVYPSR